MWRTAGQVALAGWCLAGLSACSTLQARNVAVPLHTPEPPGRVVMPPPDDVLVPAPPSPSTSVPAPMISPTNTPATSTGATTTTTPPSRTAPDRTASPPATPPAANPPEPPPVLQTASNPEKLLELQRKIQQQLDNAERDLQHVDLHALPKTARDQYDWASSMLRQARESYARKNYNFADHLSANAARLASLLPKRRPTSANAA